MKPERGSKAAVVIAAVLAIAGCGTVPTKSYFSVVNDAQPALAGTLEPVCDRPVVVPMVETAVPYDNDRIVYRTDDYEVKHYNYRLWVGHPGDMFQQLIVQRLERARLFSSVEPELHSSLNPYLFLARIDAIELLPDGERIEVRLAMSLRLRDGATNRDVWEHSFDAVQRVAGERVEVADAVRTLNAVYNAEMKSALGLLAGSLRQAP